MHPKVLESEAVARICRAHGISRLSLFGSRLEGTARPDRGVDLLVDFLPGRTPGLIGMSTIEIELEHVLGPILVT